MDKQTVIFKDLGVIDYKLAWDYQESLLQENVRVKSLIRNLENKRNNGDLSNSHASSQTAIEIQDAAIHTQHYFLLCEHPPVYTLGKSGHKENVLLSEQELQQKNISFFNTNRGGDITFHGLQQIVGYPIMDLEKYSTDIGKYLRNLEELVILTLAEYGIKGVRSKGETGVWLDADKAGLERKICAIGVRCSRWITMHGFALNVNTALDYFNHIIPCGIQNKQVTSLEKELGTAIDFEEVKIKVKKNFEIVFNAKLV